jgi:hypothetical protein
VLTPYNSTGSFLPAIAQVGCTGAHHHHFIGKQVQRAVQRRVVTHELVDQALAPAAVPAGEVVFRNQTITIVRRHANVAQREIAATPASHTVTDREE